MQHSFSTTITTNGGAALVRGNFANRRAVFWNRRESVNIWYWVLLRPLWKYWVLVLGKKWYCSCLPQWFIQIWTFTKKRHRMLMRVFWSQWHVEERANSIIMRYSDCLTGKILMRRKIQWPCVAMNFLCSHLPALVFGLLQFALQWNLKCVLQNSQRQVKLTQISRHVVLHGGTIM